jgi:hypothetical protein
MKTALIEYLLNESADADEVEREIRAFVDGIASLGAGIHYTSSRKQGRGRAYAHLGTFPSDEALKTMQAAPFFGRFAAFLNPRCAQGPTVTWLEQVASTSRAAPTR